MASGPSAAIFGGPTALALCCAVWFAANSAAAVASKLLFTDTDNRTSLVLLDVFCLKMLVTAAISSTLVAWQCGMSGLLQNAREAFRAKSELLVLAATLQALGSLTLDAAFASLSCSMGQMIKGSEPLLTVAFLGCLGLAKPTTANLLASMCILLGIAVGVMNGPRFVSIDGIVFAALSSVATSLRNILSKELDRDKTLSTTLTLAISTLLCLVTLLPLWCVKLLLNGFTAPLAPAIACAALFGMYQAASIVFLGHTDPTAHAFMNAIKRALSLYCSMYFFQDTRSRAGPLLVVIGLAAFASGKSAAVPAISQRLLARHPLGALLAILLTVAASSTITTGYPGGLLAHRFTSVPANPSLRRAFTVWVYPDKLPAPLLRSLRKVLAARILASLHVYCASTACLEQIDGLTGANPRQLTASRLSLGRPHAAVAGFVHHQVLYKTFLGLGYLDVLTLMAALHLVLSGEKRPFIDAGFLADAQQLWHATPECLLLSADHRLLYIPSGAPTGFLEHLVFGFLRMLPVVPLWPLPFRNNSWSGDPNAFENALQSAKEYCNGQCGLFHVSRLNVTFAEPSWQPTIHYGTLSHDTRVRAGGGANIGDEMQGISGLQTLPFLDTFVDRELMGDFRSVDGRPVMLFLNAWFGDIDEKRRTKWPPGPDLDPLLISVHFAEHFWPKVVRNRSYIDQLGPIGARDLTTFEFFQREKIPAYMSGCATLLIKPLPAESDAGRRIVVMEGGTKEYIEALVPIKYHSLLLYATQMQWPPHHVSLPYRHQKAYALRYLYSQARVVITARLHAAMPSVGMGIPVIFPALNDSSLPGGPGGRLKGLLDLVHTAPTDLPGAKAFNFDWDRPPVNPNGALRDRYRATLWHGIRRRPVLRDTALLMGLIPFDPAPDVARLPPETFHVILGAKDMPFTLSNRRSVESIFRHHPGAHVYLYAPKALVGSPSLAPLEVEAFTEVGYHLEVRPLDVVLGRVVVAARNITHAMVAKFFQLQTNPQYPQESGSVTPVYCHGVLLLYGGSCLGPDTFLQRPVPPELHHAVAHKPPNALFLRFPPRDPSLEDGLWRLLADLPAAPRAPSPLNICDSTQPDALCTSYVLKARHFRSLHGQDACDPDSDLAKRLDWESWQSLLALQLRGALPSPLGPLCQTALTRHCVVCDDLVQ